jgi:hypothetical protein
MTPPFQHKYKGEDHFQAIGVCHMPISGYPGKKTYVAFLDISGFKEMMKREEEAARALDRFYTTIYNVGKELPTDTGMPVAVDAIVVSDCAVLFSRNSNEGVDRINGLRSILHFVQKVNRNLIRSSLPLMTTCSIDYGEFKYEDRIEFDHIGKEYFVGQPYLNAFLDNEGRKPKIQPGQCRLIKKNLAAHNEFPIESPFSLLEDTEKYYYFYWMLTTLEDLEQFKKEYQNTYQLKYTGMISVLQKFTANAQRNPQLHR